MEDDKNLPKSFLDSLSLANKSESNNFLLHSKNNIDRDFISLLANPQNKFTNEVSVSSITPSQSANKSENTQIKFKNKILTENYSAKDSVKELTSENDNSSKSSSSDQAKENNDVVDDIFNQLNQKLVRRISDNRAFKARLSKDDMNNALKFISMQKKNSLAIKRDSNFNNFLNLHSNTANVEKRKSILRTRRSGALIHRKLSLVNPNLVVKYVKKSVEYTEFGKYYKYIKWFDFIIAILVLANIVIAIIDNELMFEENDKYIQAYVTANNITQLNESVFEYCNSRILTSQENIFRFINVILVVVIAWGLLWRYIINVRLLKSENKLSENEGIWASGLLKYMLIEMLISLIVYPPYLNNVVNGTMLGILFSYNVNSLICALISFKIYNVFKIYTYISKWTSETARSICNKHNVSPGVHFAVKAELKNRPYQVLSISMVIFTIYFGYLFRIFEYYIILDPGVVMKGENQLHYLANSMWLCIITMTTVGYGDYFPQSHLGRFIGVISCMIGLLLVSLIVVSLGQISAFDSQEEKAYYIIKKVSVVDNAVEKARNVIFIFLQLRLTLQERAKYKLSQRFVIVTQLKQEISKFKNDYKLANTYTVPDDELLKLIKNNLKNNLNSLCGNLKKLEHLDQKMNKISDNQAECLEKMEKVEERQNRIGNFLVKFNNEHFNSRMADINNEKNENIKTKSVSPKTGNSGTENKSQKDNNKKTDNEIRNIIFDPNDENILDLSNE